MDSDTEENDHKKTKVDTHKNDSNNVKKIGDIFNIPSKRK